MESIDNDLKEIFVELSEFSKTYLTCKKERLILENELKLLSERLKISQESEEKIHSKLQEKQENISKLLNMLNGFVNVKDENENLKSEIKKVQELMNLEKKNYSAEKEKWAEEKDIIIKMNREEIENMKKIRNMEVCSLNREIAHIQEENNRKIELAKKEVENNFKNQLSQTRMNYEEKLMKLSRDLISAQSEIQNLRQISNENYCTYNVSASSSTKERCIPQPLSFARYKPIVPIVSTATQLLRESEADSNKLLEDKVNSNPDNFNFPPKKKKKLYTRTDDIL